MCALGAGVPAVVSSVSGVTAKTSDIALGIENYRIRTFAPYLNTSFFISAGPLDKVEVVLEKITNHKTTHREPGKIAGKESFSLLFKDPHQAPRLGQNTYAVEHSKGQLFNLFLVPVGKSDSGYYEAVITTS